MWLKDLFDSAKEDHKFIVIDHIYESTGAWFGAYANWKENEDL